jgi:hypothetical protein
VSPLTYAISSAHTLTHNAEDMPGHIEPMFDECEYSSDASSVLRRASRVEAGWLARFARERAEQEREALELGLERELQVRRIPMRPATSPGTHKTICAVYVSTTRSSQLSSTVDARCSHDTKTCASRSRAHSLGRALAGVRRSANGAFQGRPALPGQSHVSV